MKFGGIDKLKLVIWDLDDTYWTGTFSEGAVERVGSNEKLVRELAVRGVISSICSNNDHGPIESQLKSDAMWNYFVFPAISWGPKGPAIKALLEKAQLRAPNTLFVDDRPRNLAEVEAACPGIHTCLPDELPALLAAAEQNEITDPQMERLQRYKVLEEKHLAQTEALASGSSRDEFLREAGIQVSFVQNKADHVERVHEMIDRTNQLNFTKKRISLEETQWLLGKPRFDTGVISIRDRFGDYGISGFYCVRDGALEHFLFSCRILNMGVEQWLYDKIGRPPLADGTQLFDPDFEAPNWIGEETIILPLEACDGPRVLMRGGCSLDRIGGFLGNELNSSPVLDLQQWASHSSGLVVRDHYEGDLHEVSDLFPVLSGEAVYPSTVALDREFDLLVFEWSKDYRSEVYRVDDNLYLPVAPLGFDLCAPSNQKEIEGWRKYTGAAGPWHTPIYDAAGLEFLRQSGERLDQNQRRVLMERNIRWSIERIRATSPSTVLVFLLNSTHEPSEMLDCWRHFTEEVAALNPILEQLALELGVSVVKMADHMRGPEDFDTRSPFVLSSESSISIARAIAELYEEKASQTRRAA